MCTQCLYTCVCACLCVRVRVCVDVRVYMYVYVCVRPCAQICTYTREYAYTDTRCIHNVYAYTKNLWTLCIVCRHCARSRLPGCSL